MRGLLGIIFPGKRRRGLPAHLVTRFDMTDVSDDELLVFMAGRARDRAYVARLMKRHKAKDALELLSKLPTRKVPGLGYRIMTLFQRAFGATPYDPTARIYRQYKNGLKQPYEGFHVNELRKR